MKRLFATLAFVLTIGIANAQDFRPNQFPHGIAVTPYMAHAGFGYRGLGDGNFMTFTTFQNYTGETLEVIIFSIITSR